MTPEQEFWQQEATIRHAIWRNHVQAGYTKRPIFLRWFWNREEAALKQQYEVANLRFQRSMQNAYK